MASFILTNSAINNDYPLYSIPENDEEQLSRPSSSLSSSANNITDHNSIFPKLPINVNPQEVHRLERDEKKTSSTSSWSSSFKKYESKSIPQIQFPLILPKAKPRSSRYIITKPIKDSSTTSTATNHSRTPQCYFVKFDILPNKIVDLNTENLKTGIIKYKGLGVKKVFDYKWSFFLGTNHKDDSIHLSFRLSKDNNKDSRIEVYYQSEFIVDACEKGSVQFITSASANVFFTGTRQCTPLPDLQQVVGISKLPQCTISCTFYMSRYLENLPYREDDLILA